MVEARPGGVLPVDKPTGPTSHDVVARCRRVLDEGRIGHTGTLDPFASGLLLLCVGVATRLSEYLTDLDKVYEAVAVLGRETDTLDPDGRVVERDEEWRGLDEGSVRAAFRALTGEIDQVPPQYSAKKVDGEAMYRKARRGERVRLDPARVEVRELELVEIDLPRIRFRVRCSAGTYVRALIRDAADALGTCGHLSELRRTAVGGFRVENALPMEALERPARVRDAWIVPARAVAHLPSVDVDSDTAARLAHGQAVKVPSTGSSRDTHSVPVVALLDGTLVAVTERTGDRIQPRKVFVRV